MRSIQGSGPKTSLGRDERLGGEATRKETKIGTEMLPEREEKEYSASKKRTFFRVSLRYGRIGLNQYHTGPQVSCVGSWRCDRKSVYTEVANNSVLSKEDGNTILRRKGPRDDPGLGFTLLGGNSKGETKRLRTLNVGRRPKS